MFLREAAEEIGPARFIDYPLLRNVRAKTNEHNEMWERNFSQFLGKLCIEHIIAKVSDKCKTYTYDKLTEFNFN